IPYPIQVQYEREWAEPPVRRDDLDEALRDAVIFQGLNDGQRGELLATARPAVFGAGECIVRQGEAGSSMFVIASAEATVTIEASKAPVARLRQGDFFGEMSLLTGDPRTATVAAATDCELVEITADGFRKFLMAEPVVAEQIVSAVEKRRAELEQHRAASAQQAAASPSAQSLMSRMRQFLRLSALVLAVAPAVWLHAAD